MILCHKCSGVLASRENEDDKGLLGCSCISGYVRGFEPELTREQAIERQVNAVIARIELYERQGRSAQGTDPEWAKLNALMQLQAPRA